MMMVTAVIEAKVGMGATVRQVLLQLVEPSTNEPGCLDIHLSESTEKHGRYVFITRWRNSTDFDHHLTMPYVKGFLSKASLLLAAPPQVQRWNVIAPVEA